MTDKQIFDRSHAPAWERSNEMAATMIKALKIS